MTERGFDDQLWGKLGRERGATCTVEQLQLQEQDSRGGVEDAGEFQAASGAQGGCFDVQQFQFLAGGRPEIGRAHV